MLYTYIFLISHFDADMHLQHQHQHHGWLLMQTLPTWARWLLYSWLRQLWDGAPGEMDQKPVQETVWKLAELLLRAGTGPARTKGLICHASAPWNIANTAHWRPPPDTAHPCWIWSFKQHFSFGFKNVDKDTTCTKVQEQRIKESLIFDLSKVKGSLIQSKKNKQKTTI